MTTITGGGCAGPLLSALIGGIDRSTMTVTASGASLTARFAPSSAFDSACTYTGTAGRGSISLKTTDCEAGNVYYAVCFSGATRDLWLRSDTIEATVSGRDASGTQTQIFDVVLSGTRNSVGTMTAVSTFTARK